MRLVAVAGLLLLAGRPPPAAAAEFKSSSGYSLRHPDGWSVATGANLEELDPWVREALKDIAVDMNRVDACIVRPADGVDFAVNVNVVVGKGRLPLTEEVKKEHEKDIKQMIGRAGGSIEDFKSEIETHAGIETLSATYTMNLPGADRPVRQWQVAYPGGGKVYIVTCSATPQQYPAVEPEFRRIIGSFAIDAGLLDMFNSLPPVLRYALVGGVVGGLAGLVISAFRTRSRRKDTAAASRS